jgi:hypothetical protein
MPFDKPMKATIKLSVTEVEDIIKQVILERGKRPHGAARPLSRPYTVGDEFGSEVEYRFDGYEIDIEVAPVTP